MSVTFMAVNANDKRLVCYAQGEGFYVDNPVSCGDEPNFNNANAQCILECLGLVEKDDHELCGRAEILEFLAALDVADTFFQDEGVKHTREPWRERNFISFGLDEAGLKSRLANLRNYAATARNVGATHITWG